MRTPLNAILGYSDLLADEMRDRGADDLRVDLEKIRRAAGHQLALVTEALDLGKIKAGEAELHLTTFDAARLVREAAEIAWPLVKKGHNRLESGGVDALGAVFSNEGKLRQVLLNLLSNAARFTEKGTISIEAAHARHADDPRARHRSRDVARAAPSGSSPPTRRRVPGRRPSTAAPVWGSSSPRLLRAAARLSRSGKRAREGLDVHGQAPREAREAGRGAVKSQQGAWRFLAGLARPYRGRFLVIALLALLGTAADLVEPLIYRTAVNDVAGLFVGQASETVDSEGELPEEALPSAAPAEAFASPAGPGEVSSPRAESSPAASPTVTPTPTKSPAKGAGSCGRSPVSGSEDGGTTSGTPGPPPGVPGSPGAPPPPVPAKEPHRSDYVAPRTPGQTITTLLWAVALLFVTGVLSYVFALAADNRSAV